jgi:spore germination protein GerM
MAAEKKVNKSSAKKKSASGSVKGKTGTAKKKTANKDRGKGPFYMLVILFLLTVIVFLINISYDSLPFKLNQDGRDIFQDHGKGKVIIGKEDIGNTIPDSSTEKIKTERKTAEEAKKDDGKDTAEKSIDVKIYFLKLDENTEQLYLSSVTRKVSDKNILRLSLETLISGPSPSEKSAGYMSAVPSSLRVNRVAIKGRSAVIDFSGAIEEDAPGQILIKRLQQIVYTATAIDGVDNLLITINGKAKKSIGADGLSISGPIGR